MKREDFSRTGSGLDFHAFGEGRRLVLGGVDIAHPKGLIGHSDGDALAHAIIDALLGAASRGDIGQWFPSDDPKYKDADSIEMLRTVVTTLREEGWQVVNVDSTVLAKEPRLTPHVAMMKIRLADALAIPPSYVSVKASTADRLGTLGRGEGVAVQAIAVLIQLSEPID
jgi:2-C-methyl-D-erythritol 2,4-cyclodiphosphate synthase